MYIGQQQFRNQRLSQIHKTSRSHIAISHLLCDPPTPNHLSDFVNATYQGLLSTSASTQSKPDGPGVIIDDQFNFILCSDWLNGKINGSVFIKLINEIIVWGQWHNGRPISIIAAKLNEYTLLLPQFDHMNQLQTRPTRCIIYNEKKQRAYLTVMTKKQEPLNYNHIKSQAKKQHRQYSIIIEKIISCKTSKKLRSILQTHLLRKENNINREIQEKVYNIREYITDLQSKNIIQCCRDLLQNGWETECNSRNKQSQDRKNLLICLDQQILQNDNTGISKSSRQAFCQQVLQSYNNYTNPHIHGRKSVIVNVKLGVLLDLRNLAIKSVGHYRISSSYSDRGISIINQYSLNGLGLTKSLDITPIVGFFKNDMLIKQITSFNEQRQSTDLQNIKMPIIQFTDIKQQLAHEHMKSLWYQHHFVYYRELRQLVKLGVEMFQYASMFERLAENRDGIESSEISSDQTLPNNNYSYENGKVCVQRNDETNGDFKGWRRSIQKIRIQSEDQQQSIGDMCRKEVKLSSDSSSIIEQFGKEFKINLPKSIYSKEISQNYNSINHKQNQEIHDSLSKNKRKKPGFIVSKSPKSQIHTPKTIKNGESPKTIKLNQRPSMLYGNQRRINGTIIDTKLKYNNYIHDKSSSKSYGNSKSRSKDKNQYNYRRMLEDGWKI